MHGYSKGLYRILVHGQEKKFEGVTILEYDPNSGSMGSIYAEEKGICCSMYNTKAHCHIYFLPVTAILRPDK